MAEMMRNGCTTAAAGAETIQDIDERSGYSKSTGIYYSRRPAVKIPDVSFLSVTQHVLANHHGNKVALVDCSTGKSLTFTELEHLVMALAAGLIGKIGVSSGNTVMLIAPNSILYPVVCFSVMGIGAVLTTANYVNTPREIHKQIKDSETKFVVTMPSMVAKLRQFGLPLLLIQAQGDSTYERNSDDPPIFFISDLLKNTERYDINAARIHQEDMAALLYSSGTTGMSKGVVISHHNLIASALTQFSLPPKEDEVILCFLPLFHIFAFSFLCASLWRGTEVVVMPRFNLEAMLEAVDRHRVTSLFVVPPVLSSLVLRYRSGGGGSRKDVVVDPGLQSLRCVICGGAPLAEELIKEFVRIYPHLQFLQGYGLTEAGGALTYLYDDDLIRIGSCGRLIANVKAKIVDIDGGRPLPPYQKGELWSLGPTISRGYLRNIEATMDTIDQEGWLKTGDIGFIDGDGYLFLVDRLKDLIKYKSYQVAPAELEAILISHPEIIDVAVTRFPDQQTGEIPMAFVVRLSRSTLDEDKVIRYVAAQVAPYKRIRRVAFVEAIPRTLSGKILRKELTNLLHSTL